MTNDKSPSHSGAWEFVIGEVASPGHTPGWQCLILTLRVHTAFFSGSNTMLDGSTICAITPLGQALLSKWSVGLNDSQNQRHVFANPSPEGRGRRPSLDGRRVRGTRMKSMKQRPVVPLTRPAGAGHPLPSGEGFARMHFPIGSAQHGGGRPLHISE